ncbi:YhdP family protein [Agaribacterium sp. ZY112]|uniref:YhdP family phospholipid transporter n=1 Tax=Agaribacterium sp. ZY112 TaxID=3233574 RepID=UPI00352692BC
MFKRHLRLLTRRFWGFILGSIIAFAVLVQIGRQAFPLLNDYRHVIADSLGAQLGVDVELLGIAAQWKGLKPQIVLGQLQIKNNDGQEIFHVDTALAELSILDSIAQRGLAWRTIVFENFSTTIEQRQDNSWGIKGYSGGTANTESSFAFDDPLDIFLFGRRVEIRSAELNFEFLNGKTSQLDIPVISLENDRFFHRLSANFNLNDQESLRVVVEGYGDPRNEQRFSASAYIQLKQIPVDDIYAALKKVEQQIAVEDQTGASALDKFADDRGQGKLDFELWLDGSPKDGVSAKGRISLTGLPHDIQKNIALPESLTADVSGFWQRAKGWNLSLQDMSIIFSGEPLPFDTFSFYGKDASVGLRIAHFNIGDLSQHFLRANEGRDHPVVNVIRSLNLSGQLSDVDLAYVGEERGWFNLRAQLKDGYSAAFMGSPELKNIDGYVESSLFGGFVNADIRNEPFSLFLPKVFDQAFTLDNVKGQLAWRVDLEQRKAFLHSAQLSSLTEDRYVSGFFSMVLPFSSDVGEPSLDLSIYADRAPATSYSQYVPRMVPDELDRWLALAIRDGQASNINVFYHGSVSLNPKQAALFQLDLAVDNASLKFDEHWPELSAVSAKLSLDDNVFNAEVRQAELDGNDVSYARVSVGKNAKAVHELNVQADINGALTDAQVFLLDSPIADSVESFLSSWQLLGRHKSRFHLTLPFQNMERDLDYSVSTQLVGAELYMPRLNLRYEDINGAFAVNKSHLVQAKALTAKLWDKPISLGIQTHKDLSEMDVHFTGEVNVDALQAWSKRPELFALSGDFSVKGLLNLPLSESANTEGLNLDLSSNLKNSSIDLPGALKKEAGETGLFELSIQQLDYGLRYHYQHNNQFELLLDSYDADLAVNTQVVSEHAPQDSTALHITIGESLPEQERLKPGLSLITGYLDEVSYEQWSSWLERLLEQEKRFDPEEQESDGFQARIELNVGNFVFADLSMPSVALNIDGNNRRWRFEGKSEQFDGAVTLPLGDGPLLLDFDYLSVYEGEHGSLSAADEFSDFDLDEPRVSALSDFDLSSVAAMQVSIQELRMHDQDYGHWFFDVVPIEQGLRFESIEAEVRHLKIGAAQGGQFIWTKDEQGQHHSALTARIQTEDVGQALEAWGQERMLESRLAWFDLDVSWSAEPDMPQLEILNGNLELELHKGSFIRGADAGENPLLRLIALFNFDTFARRLRLDFSDLAAKGFAYDKVHAKMRFNEGLASLDEPMLVESSSSKMRMAGDIDIVNETLDTELAVTLPVAGNIVVATAFLAGLPAGLGVYVISKMFSKQVDKASSISYSVRGAWEDPKIKVLKVFNDDVENKPSKAEHEVRTETKFDTGNTKSTMESELNKHGEGSPENRSMISRTELLQ